MSVWIPPGEKHWHGGSPTNGMTHIAMQEALDGVYSNWMEQVTDAEYSANSRWLAAGTPAAGRDALRHMIPWLQIESARVPGADVELRLMRRGAEFSMMLGPNELMNSRLSGSEEALATLACRRIARVRRPDVLIGGLGMGFTLRAALEVLGNQARIVVAELWPP